MTKEEVIQNFIENEVEPAILENMLELEEYFQTNKDRLLDGFVRSFQRICMKIKEMQLQSQKDKIGHITYSMLRTEIQEGRYGYLIEASDSSWFFDPIECQDEYDASWAFQFLERLVEYLEEKRRNYMGTITRMDIEKIRNKEAEKYNQYVAILAQYAMPYGIALLEYKDIDKEEEVEVRVGEYMDISEIVYKEDSRMKEATEIKAWLEEKLEYEYAYEVFRNLDLSKGNYEGIDLRYADVEQSNVSNSKLSECVLLGTKFMETNLWETDFSRSFISGANFRNSDLRGAIFHEVEGSSGLFDPSSWEMPGFLSVNFEGANLEGADFKNANLKGAVFVEANLAYTNFTGANLEHAIFSRADLGRVKLDDRQMDSVIWKL
ncbi:pentapeptide repeat-containing protein [Aneurinibacillus soli]|uniref:pentapeptide repeat-containing protein n=1 Tax=Aneurinibacillus soli TaxID=1500254 RepID=UPI000BBA6378|nr:pentapeptide repeat-containing protein [Aneurinibacillus soli]